MADVQVIHGDCLDVLPTLASGSVDAVITDPPYNVRLQYGECDDGRTEADYRDWCARWFAELRRVCKGPVLITCGVANLGVWHTIEKPKWVMCWWKPASSGRCAVGFNNWEPVLVYGRLTRVTCDVVRTTEQASLPVRHKSEAIAHPCPKPVEWAAKLVDISCSSGGLVLDPFAGSGTTGVACVQTSRRFIGVEQHAPYVEIARRRIAAAQAERPLFAEGAANG